MSTPRHPVQPIVKDEHGIERFKANAIVKYLLEAGPFSLNDIAIRGGFSRDDHEQFAQLIGYSVSGYSTLSYASDETLACCGVDDDVEQLEERIRYLRGILEKVREGVRVFAPDLFEKHPDTFEL